MEVRSTRLGLREVDFGLLIYETPSRMGLQLLDVEYLMMDGNTNACMPT